MNLNLKITWRPEKAKAVQQERGLTQEEVETVFLDPNAIVEFDEAHSSQSQDRWKLIGVSSRSRILTVIYCELDLDPKGSFRHVTIITAWKATTQEKRRYAGE